MSNDTSGNHEPKSGNGPRAEPAADEQFLIVGLGASAGGIQALKSFFTEVPKDSGFAYVVILHMSPEHESKLAEILQIASPIPVTQIQQRTKVEPNQVYVVSPNHTAGDGGRTSGAQKHNRSRGTTLTSGSVLSHPWPKAMSTVPSR